ncbi:MAG TPA: nuclear transport factor 2 family protein [Parvibaculum sp.]
MADTEQTILALAARLLTAIETVNLDEIRRCYCEDARIWHNFDNIDQTVEENLKTFLWMQGAMSDIKYDVRRRFAFPGGYVQQHVLTAKRADGKAFAIPACVVVTVKDGRISRLEEYLDPAPALAPAASATGEAAGVESA